MLPSSRRRHTWSRSRNSVSTSNDVRWRFSRKQNLGDKLHHLARLSPAHVKIVEVLVDQMLRSLKAA